MFKTNVWLDYDKIRANIDISRDALIQNLKSVYDTWGGRKRVLFRDGQYFLHKDYFDEFVNRFNLVNLKKVPVQDIHWTPVIRLVSLYQIPVYKIVKLVRDIKDKDLASMRDEKGMPLIQFRRTAHGHNTALCLFNSNDARKKLATELGVKINTLSPIKVPYKMQYNWSAKRKFSDDEIHNTIISLMEKNYDFVTESQCADALLSELPKSSHQILLAHLAEQKNKQKD